MNVVDITRLASSSFAWQSVLVALAKSNHISIKAKREKEWAEQRPLYHMHVFYNLLNGTRKVRTVTCHLEHCLLFFINHMVVLILSAKFQITGRPLWRARIGFSLFISPFRSSLYTFQCNFEQNFVWVDCFTIHKCFQQDMNSLFLNYTERKQQRKCRDTQWTCFTLSHFTFRSLVESEFCHVLFIHQFEYHFLWVIC